MQTPKLGRNTSLLLALMLTVGGAIYQWNRPDLHIFSLGMFFALLWLALASSLIKKAHERARRFFTVVEGLVTDGGPLRSIESEELRRLKSPGNVVVGVFLALLAGVLPAIAGYRQTTFSTVWASLVLSAVFLYAGVGFWGLYVVVRIISRITETSVSLEVNPFDSDHAGGLSKLQEFVRAAETFYFSGGLLVPAAYELAMLGRGLTLVRLLAILYFGLGVVCYFVGQGRVVKRVGIEKEKIVSDAARQIKKLVASGGNVDQIQIQLSLLAAAEKMQSSVFTLFDIAHAGGKALASSVPLILTSLAHHSPWPSLLDTVSPILKDLFS